MANWKIQDIAPPKQRRRMQAEEEPVQEESQVPLRTERRHSGGGRSLWLTAVLIPFILVVLLGFGALHFFFAQAKVTVWPETRDIAVSQAISADTTAQTASIADSVIPATAYSVSKEETRLFPSSSTTIREDRASGTIRVFNAADTSSKTLVAQTRFVAQGGQLFRSPIGVVIPGGTQQGGKLVPGYIDIKVVAAEPGASYNIGPSNFSLPGLSGSALFTTIYAESFESMTGGSERQVNIVSLDDIESAKEKLTSDLTAKATQELLARVPEGMVADEGSVVVEVQEAVSPIQPGSEIDQFNVSVKLEATLYAVAVRDVQSFVDALVITEVEQGERIASDKTVYSFSQAAPGSGSVASLNLEVSAVAYEHTDETELKLKLRGKSSADAQSALLSIPSLKQSEISFWPFWISSVPGNVDKLKVNMVID